MEELKVFKVTTEYQPITNCWSSEAINERNLTELIVIRTNAEQSLFDLYRSMIKYHSQFKLVTKTEELIYIRKEISIV